ncbi:TPA: hypothetical protein P0E07_001182 [Vibrio fluvialis]|nr:hypothetical protein [Vibrio fluvialis]
MDNNKSDNPQEAVKNIYEEFKSSFKKSNDFRKQEEKVSEEQSQQAQDAINRILDSGKQHDPETRSTLSLNFLLYFFALLAGSYVFVLVYNNVAVNWILQLKNAGLNDQIQSVSLLDFNSVISLVISGLGTSLGFIIGYYFKDKSSK